MNNDLISREALKKAIFEHCRSEEENFYHFWFDENLIALIDNAPTVDMNTELSVAYLKGRRQGQSDVRPQGEWIRKEDVIHLLKYWSDGYCYIGIPTDDAIKAIKDMKGGAE